MSKDESKTETHFEKAESPFIPTYVHDPHVFFSQGAEVFDEILLDAD